MSNISKLDAVPAVNNLTDEAAAIVEGGYGTYRYPLRFDALLPSPSFLVPRGGNVYFVSNTRSSPSNKSFTAVLRNLNTGNTTSQTVAVGDVKGASWKGVRGGLYRVDLVDSRDGVFVSGSATVVFS